MFKSHYYAVSALTRLFRSYTGYIDVEARHLFFYFFESRNDPDKDDVIFWTSGGEQAVITPKNADNLSEGPGGSSAFGLFMELGAWYQLL